MPDDESSAHSTLHQDEEEGQVQYFKNTFGFPETVRGKWPSASAMRKPSLIASRTTPILMGL